MRGGKVGGQPYRLGDWASPSPSCFLQPFEAKPYRIGHMELTTPGVATLRRDPDQRALRDAETAHAALAAAGDGRAFERLRRPHVARVHSLVRRMVGPDQADDNAQDGSAGACNQF